ncbi:MAG: SRPBCC domain-containing protein, partial [Betaproteobacteria bacterium]
MITRVFDAPRHLVWEAATRPELVRRWWGPCTSEVVICEIDLRVGGAWRNVLRFPDGSEHAFHGVYREIV